MLCTQSNGFNRQVVCSLNGETDGTIDFFSVAVPVSAGTATTTIIPDSQIPAGKKVYLIDYAITSAGSAWTTGTNIKIQDSPGTVTFATVTTANLPTSSASVTSVLGTSTKGEGLATGGTAAKGLVLTQTGSYAGSDAITVRVTGYLATTDTITYS